MDSNYVLYKNTIRSLQSLLGFTCINIWESTNLYPYSLKVLTYLNECLVTKDPDTIYTAIKELCEVIDEGNEFLLEGSLEDLYAIMDLSDRDRDTWSDYLFCTAWANVCTSLWDTAKCNYASVLWDLEHQDCECDCGCSSEEVEEDDNLYSKLVGNGASTSSSSSSGCGCGS